MELFDKRLYTWVDTTYFPSMQKILNPYNNRYNCSNVYIEALVDEQNSEHYLEQKSNIDIIYQVTFIFDV